MDGTRRARLLALGVTLVCGLTLLTAALLATARHDGGSPGGADMVVRTPISVLTGSPVTSASAVAPRTTPPPTNPAADTGTVPAPAPSAATTVGRS